MENIGLRSKIITSNQSLRKIDKILEEVKENYGLNLWVSLSNGSEVRLMEGNNHFEHGTSRRFKGSHDNIQSLLNYLESLDLSVLKVSLEEERKALMEANTCIKEIQMITGIEFHTYYSNFYGKQFLYAKEDMIVHSDEFSTEHENVFSLLKYLEHKKETLNI